MASFSTFYEVVKIAFSVILSVLCRFGGTARSRRPMQHALSAQILVNIRPMDPVTRSGKTPICPLLRCRMQQAWIPRQRGCYRPSIEEVNADNVIGEAHITDTLTRFRFLSSHTMPPIISKYFPYVVAARTSSLHLAKSLVSTSRFMPAGFPRWLFPAPF